MKKSTRNEEKIAFSIASFSLLNGNYFNDNSNCLLNMSEMYWLCVCVLVCCVRVRICYQHSQNNYCGNCFNTRCDSTWYSFRICNKVNHFCYKLLLMLLLLVYKQKPNFVGIELCLSANRFERSLKSTFCQEFRNKIVADTHFTLM